MEAPGEKTLGQGRVADQGDTQTFRGFQQTVTLNGPIHKTDPNLVGHQGYPLFGQDSMGPLHIGGTEIADPYGRYRPRRDKSAHCDSLFFN